jgi:ribosomal protein L16 Arg81 hydroxylase
MSSWFSNLKDLSKDFTDKVSAAIPKIDNETLQKLTLNTPDLILQREEFQNEFQHKIACKTNSLGNMYPWETRDDERDILVEECKEAIMGLSLSSETFFGPYSMPLLGSHSHHYYLVKPVGT